MSHEPYTRKIIAFPLSIVPEGPLPLLKKR